VRILGTIVLPPTALMAVFDPEIAGSSAIRPQVIRDQPIGNEAVFLQKFAHQFQRGVLVSPGLDQHIEDLAFGVDGAPQINHAAIDFQVGFVQMPGRVGLRAPFAQVCCDHRPEMIHPASNRLIRHRDASLRQQIFDVAEAQCEPKIEPDRLLNDLRRKPVPGVTDLLHPPGYRAASGTASQRRRDNARSEA
jgi:hypothetical protein